MQLVSKLVDCEFNQNCEKYRAILQLATHNQIKRMSLADYLMHNDNATINSKCYTIIKCLCESHQYEVEDCIGKDKKLINNYCIWLED